jgi:hypothetical protein
MCPSSYLGILRVQSQTSVINLFVASFINFTVPNHLLCLSLHSQLQLVPPKLRDAGTLQSDNYTYTYAGHYSLIATLTRGHCSLIATHTLTRGHCSLIATHTLTRGHCSLIATRTLTRGHCSLIATHTLTRGHCSLIATHTLTRGHCSLIATRTIFERTLVAPSSV